MSRLFVVVVVTPGRPAPTKLYTVITAGFKGGGSGAQAFHQQGASHQTPEFFGE